jgi:hypothetical protein
MGVRINLRRTCSLWGAIRIGVRIAIRTGIRIELGGRHSLATKHLYLMLWSIMGVRTNLRRTRSLSPCGAIRIGGG